MINVNGALINEKLIKTVIPYFQPPIEEWVGCPPPAVKITFTDGTEKIYYNMDTFQLWNELKGIGVNS